MVSIEIGIGNCRQVRHGPFKLREDARERNLVVAERDDVPSGQRTSGANTAGCSRFPEMSLSNASTRFRMSSSLRR
jgi:hypothetical protein